MIRTVLLSVALPCWAPFAMAQGDPTIQVIEGDPEIAEAVEAARETLDLFLTNVVDSDGYSLRGADVKVAIPTGDESVKIENIWVGPFGTPDGTRFVGALANEPNMLAGLSLGSKVSFSRDMIVDWSIVSPDGMRFGNYTTRVVLNRMDPAQAAEIIQQFPDDPVPPDWR